MRYGSYSDCTVEGKCNAVVQSDTAVIFLELKGKVLNRVSRAGDDVKALADMTDSMVRPQAQAMARSAFLQQHRSAELTAPSGTSQIELAGREVFKSMLPEVSFGACTIDLFFSTSCVQDA